MSKKYWDIIPPRKKKTDSLEDFIKKIEKLTPEDYKDYLPKRFMPKEYHDFPQGCLHRGCDHARNPFCMLSCPNPCCSPWMLTTIREDVLFC